MPLYLKKLSGSILMLIVLGFPAKAQFFAAGEDPFSISWRQIHTENFQVIFPEEYEEQAKYITDVLEWSYQNATESLDHSPRKVSVIIHNQTVISNGFVSWAPRRAELYTNPPANNDTHDWLERLTIHEFRHVVQIDKLNQGLTRLLGFLFGEMATGAVVAHLPMWFLEGDAVAAETALTHSGRGRRPSFEQGLRALTLEKGIHSFDKAYFGSYKDYVPNYYELGYQLVTSARAEHGTMAWSPVIDNVARRPVLPFPFSREMKRQFGQSKDNHYFHTFQTLDSLWSQQKNQHTYTPAETISKGNRIYTNYNQAHWIDNQTVIALKTGLGDIPGVVKINLENGEETRLFEPGRFFPNAFDYSSGKIVWNELRPDPRWEHRSWSDIMMYDVASGSRKRITHKGRYFSPALSPDGLVIAAVETSATNRYALVLLDASTGKETWRFSYESNDFIMQPAWHEDGQKIAILALDEAGKRIDILNPESATIETVLSSTHTEISSPCFHDDNILFTGSWSGIHKTYKLNTDNQDVEKVISTKYGATEASSSPQGDKVMFSSYTTEGYQLQTIQTENLAHIPLSQVENHSPARHQTLSEQENAVINRSELPRNDYETEPYSRLRNLFHLHSWAPVHLDMETQEASMGASLLFQNKLSTSFANIGYIWDESERTGKFSARYTYRGWYPVVDLLAESGHRRFYYPWEDTEVRNFLWTENTYRVALSVPLQFQSGPWFYGINPRVRVGAIYANKNRHTPDSIFVAEDRFFQFEENQFYTQDYRLLAYRQKRSVARDIYPSWGQVADVNYRHTPFGKGDMGSVFAARGIAYFPGLFKHQGLRLSLSWQQKTAGTPQPNSVNYGFGNHIPYPRGIAATEHEEITSMSADYAFPLLYPDLSLRHIIYLKRLRGHIFTDHATARRFSDEENADLPLEEDFTSLGFGITGDLHLLRIFAPISMGVEVAFPRGKNEHYRFIFSVSLP